MTQNIKKQHNYQHKTTITQDTTESKYINTFTKHKKHYRRCQKTDIHDTGHKDIENVNSDTRNEKQHNYQQDNNNNDTGHNREYKHKHFYKTYKALYYSYCHKRFMTQDTKGRNKTRALIKDSILKK